jgi:hypothetical protein
MSVQNDHQASHSQAEDAWTDYGSDFVLIAEGKPLLHIELARDGSSSAASTWACCEPLPTTTALSLPAIAQGLRARNEPPEELPPELTVLLERLKEQRQQ